MFSKSSPRLALPGYLKFFVIFSSLMLTGYLLIQGRTIINPLITAFIVGIIVKPIADRMENIGISRGFSSVLSILLIFLLLAGLFLFFSLQINNITNDLNQIGKRFTELIDRAFILVERLIGVKPEEQIVYLKESFQNILKNSSSFFSQTLTATADFVTGLVLFLISLFFVLFYRSFFVAFIFKLFNSRHHTKVHFTLRKVEKVVRGYILGLLLVISAIAVLNVVSLSLLGIQHAVFFGVLAALLTVIPYIGVLVGSLLPALFALVTKDSLWYPFGVIVSFWFVQFLEGNFITPNVVGDKVSINPFAAIMSLFLGGILLGTIGMIFAIPLLAIIKVICASVDSLKPVAFIIGNPPQNKSGPQRSFHQFNRFKQFKTPARREGGGDI